MKKLILYLFITLSAINSNSQNPEWVPSVNIEVDHYNHVFCHDGLGRAEAFVTGGIGPFEYTWFDFFGNVVGHGLVLDSVPAPEYQYYFEVRKDTMLEGTGYWWDVLMTNPDSIVIEFNTHVLPSGFNISAPDSSDGQITVNVYGGVPGYSYLWSNGSQSPNISNLSKGPFTLTVTDFIGCTKSKSVTLTEPPSDLHVVSISSPTYNGYNISKNGIPDGKINLNINGGTPPYKIRWSPLGEADDKNPDTLWARQYTAEITDAGGITKVTAKISLTEPPKLQLSLTPTNPTCNNCNNGTIAANVSGGVSPYTYLWSNGATTSSISNLAAGEYWVKVIDRNDAGLKETTYLKAPERDDWSMSGNSNITSINFIGTTNLADLIIKANDVERIKIIPNGPIDLNGQIKLDSLSPDTINAVYVDDHGNLKYSSNTSSSGCYAPAYAFARKLCATGDNNFYFISKNSNSKLVIGPAPTLPGDYKMYVTGGILTEKLRVADPASNYWADNVFNDDYKLMDISELNKFIIKNNHLPGIPTTEQVKAEGLDVGEIQGKLLAKIEELTLYLIKQQNEIDQLKEMIKK